MPSGVSFLTNRVDGGNFTSSMVNDRLHVNGVMVPVENWPAAFILFGEMSVQSSEARWIYRLKIDDDVYEYLTQPPRGGCFIYSAEITKNGEPFRQLQLSYPSSICGVTPQGENFHFYRYLRAADLSVGDHLFTLEKIDGHSEPKEGFGEFLLNCIFVKIPGYRVVGYKSRNSELMELYETLRSASSGASLSSIIFMMVDQMGYQISYNKDKKEFFLIKKTYLDDSDYVGEVIDKVFIPLEHPLKKSSYTGSFLDDLRKKEEQELRLKKLGTAVDYFIPSHNYAFKDVSVYELNNAIDNMFSRGSKIYGVSLPQEAVNQVKYDKGTNAYCWYDEGGSLHSPHPDLPSAIHPDGRLFYHQNGNLHRESGPALVDLYDRRANRWFLHGRPVSEDEYRRYDHASRRIEFRDAFSLLHRHSAPAVIEFNEDGTTTESYFNHGLKTFTVKNKKPYYVPHCTDRLEFDVTDYEAKRKVVKVTRKSDGATPDSSYSKSIYKELSKEELDAIKSVFRDNKSYLLKYKNEIHKRAQEIASKRGLNMGDLWGKDDLKVKTEPLVKEALSAQGALAKEVPQEETELEIKKKVRSAPDLTGTRFSQVKNGFTFGFKKQVIHNSSQLLAEKLVDLTPMEGNQWVERFLQICFLLGSAELMERMPEGLAEKLRLSEDTRLNFGSTLRYVSGESIGRDAIDIVANILPLFAEILKGVTTEELADLSTEFENDEEVKILEDAKVPATEDLFHKVEELHYEEVGVR